MENKKRLADLQVGDCFMAGEHQFVVLEHCIDSTAVILKNLLEERMPFGKNNNYKRSNVDGICNEFAGRLSAIVGEENLVEHEVDLTSDDGLEDYGCVQLRVSLLTCDRYRKYVHVLDKHKPDKWWWLATAWSTPAHGVSDGCKCVSPSGGINFDNCYCRLGVRPFCILKSSIFVSVEEE